MSDNPTTGERGTCWMWKGSRRPKGYGSTYDGGLAHRAVYETLVGPIPTGLQVDHLCRNTGCVRPDHLELVTSRENTLRGHGPTARHAKQATCKWGHPFTGTKKADGSRLCKTCKNIDAKHRRLRAKEAKP